MILRPLRIGIPALLVVAIVAHGDVRAQDRRLSRVPAPVGTSGAAQELYAGSHALLVGVSRYDTPSAWAALDSVPGELNELAAALRAAGFDTVEQLSNPTGADLRRGMEDFIGRYGYVKERRLLFYFSGHGYTLDAGARGYFVPRDAPDPLENEAAFRRTAISMDQVATWARDLVARHALFSFDSCFSGTIFRTRDRAIPQRISEMTARPVREFMSAGGPGEPVPARSVYTPMFIRGLKGAADLDQDGFVTGTELGNYVQREVIAYKTRQTPQFGKIRDPELDEGDFVFAIPVATTPAPPPNPPPVPAATPVTSPRRVLTTRLPERAQLQPDLVATTLALAERAAKGQPSVRPLDVSVARRDFFKAVGDQTYIVYSLIADAGRSPAKGLVVYVRAVAAGPVGAASPPWGTKPAWDDISYFAPSSAARAEVRRALALAPGAYHLYVVVTEAGEAEPRWASIVERLDVPDFSRDGLAISSVMLADRTTVLAAPVEPADKQAHPYAFGTVEFGVVPQPIFRRSDELNAGFFIYNSLRGPSGSPDLRVDFDFHHVTAAGAKFFNRTAPQLWNQGTLSAQDAITAGQAVPLASFAPGDYRLDITVTDQVVGGRRFTTSVRFTVEGP